MPHSNYRPIERSEIQILFSFYDIFTGPLLSYTSETSNVGASAGRGTTPKNAGTEHRDAATNGSFVCGKRAPPERNFNPSRYHQGKCNANISQHMEKDF